MNRDRRNQISEALNELSNLKDVIEALAADEQDSFDAMPEGLQNSDRGTQSEEAASALDEAGALLSDILDLLEQAKGA